jgi:hypothetical protein
VPGEGILVDVADKRVAFGNRRLMKDQSIEIVASEPDLLRLESEGKTAMLLAVDGAMAGVIAVADTLKPEAKEAVETLQSRTSTHSLEWRQQAHRGSHRSKWHTNVIAEVLRPTATVIKDQARQGRGNGRRRR